MSVHCQNSVYIPVWPYMSQERKTPITCATKRKLKLFHPLTRNYQHMEKLITTVPVLLINILNRRCTQLCSYFRWSYILESMTYKSYASRSALLATGKDGLSEYQDNLTAWYISSWYRLFSVSVGQQYIAPWKESLFYLSTSLENIDFHIIGY